MAQSKLRSTENFIEFVRCQPCCKAAIDGGKFIKPILFNVRQSDPHHLRSYTNNTRRYCDWFVVPLSRANHSWLDTYAGKLWEKENDYNLYRYCGYLLVSYRLYEQNPFLSIETLRQDCYTVLEDYKNATIH